MYVPQYASLRVYHRVYIAWYTMVDALGGIYPGIPWWDTLVGVHSPVYHGGYASLGTPSMPPTVLAVLHASLPVYRLPR